ncbi:hypothetical protein ACPPVO_33375 [Dactylosporangium sp. McL0621]|uniref:hypothetical protein n=1 Tax=Dactylosporangium sp. McL0621 TaxID=3415678 RepID=UPI003CE6D448
MFDERPRGREPVRIAGLGEDRGRADRGQAGIEVTNSVRWSSSRTAVIRGLGIGHPAVRLAPHSVAVDMAVVLADGGQGISDLAVLRQQPAVFGSPRRRSALGDHHDTSGVLRFRVLPVMGWCGDLWFSGD